MRNSYTVIYKLSMGKTEVQKNNKNLPSNKSNSEYFLVHPSESLLRFFIIQIVEALQVLRNVGFVHNDLRIDNIIITKAFTLKLIDFGNNERISQGKAIQLTHMKDSESQNLAPEYYIKNNTVGYFDAYKGDYFSLGVLIYFMKTFEYPVSDLKTIDIKDDERYGFLKKELQDKIFNFPELDASDDLKKFLASKLYNYFLLIYYLVLLNPTISERSDLGDIINNKWLNQYLYTTRSKINP